MLLFQLIRFFPSSLGTTLQLHTQTCGALCVVVWVYVTEQSRDHSYFHGIFDKYTKYENFHLGYEGNVILNSIMESTTF